MEKIIFDDEITLWWQPEKRHAEIKKYKFYLDGKYHGETRKTHYTFSGLFPERVYQVRIETVFGGKERTEKEYIFRTKKFRKYLDITKEPYCAVGDGKTLNTAAIQRAFDDCTAEYRVYIPAGEFLTGALDIHSDSELYLAEGAILKGSEKVADYLPKIKSRFEGVEMECYRSLINIGELDSDGGYTTKNVYIRGKGTVFGGGVELAANTLAAEKERLKGYLEENAEYVKTCENKDTIPGRARGRLVNINNAKNVVMGGVTFGYAPSWNIHFVYSRDIITYGCRIMSGDLIGDEGKVLMQRVWNGDGWDPDSSENCIVFDTEFHTFDNAIAIKSGKNPEGNIVARPTKDVYIFDCRGRNDLAIGSEISGGVDGVYIWDCVFTKSWGLNIKTTAARGGYIRNVFASNCEFASVTVRTRLVFNNDGASAGSLTKIENLSFKDLTLHGVFVDNEQGRKVIPPIFMDGFDGEGNGIENVTIKDVKISSQEDGKLQEICCKNATNISIENLYSE